MDKVMQDKKAIFLFILPAAILFLGIIIIPIFMSGYYSMLDWDGITKPTFIGLENYKELFTSISAGFTKTVSNTMLLAVLSTVIQLPLALIIALVLARGVPGEKFFVTVFFIPVILSMVVIGQLWMKIYNPDYGIINSFLRSIGLDNLTHVWLGEQDTALFAVFIPILWQYVGYHMLLMYAGIKSISPEINEAAKIDGATGAKTAWYITIPLIKPIIKVCVIFAVTGSLKAFQTLSGSYTKEWGPIGAALAIATIPTLLIYCFMSNRIQESMVLGAVKG